MAVDEPIQVQTGGVPVGKEYNGHNKEHINGFY